MCAPVTALVSSALCERPIFDLSQVSTVDPPLSIYTRAFTGINPPDAYTSSAADH